MKPQHFTTVKVDCKKILKETKVLDTTEGFFIYFLIKDDVIVYVGQSKTLRNRIANHKADKDFDRTQYLRVPEEQQCLLELALIKALKPMYNKQPLGPMSADEKEILGSYNFQEDTLVSLMKSQPHPERYHYGPVGYFDEDGNPHVGLYDGEEDFQEHDDECPMGQALEILVDLKEEKDVHLYEALYDYCTCECDCIIMDGFLTYVPSRPRLELYDVSAPEFEPLLEKFQKKFFQDYEDMSKQGDKHGS